MLLAIVTLKRMVDRCQCHERRVLAAQNELKMSYIKRRFSSSNNASSEFSVPKAKAIKIDQKNGKKISVLALSMSETTEGRNETK